MIQRSWLQIAAMGSAACSPNSSTSAARPGTVAPTGAAAGAESVVKEFMQAVADSNHAKMADLWGSAKGPAARTKEPADYERRIVVMQVYLRDSPYRILSNAQDGTNVARRVLQVEVKRDKCVKIVPFTAVLGSGNQWIITSIDLALLGSPGANCSEDDKKE